MRIRQNHWTPRDGWSGTGATVGDGSANALTLMFGSSTLLRDPAILDDVRRLHPGARLLGCSTAGEIRDTRVTDDSIVATTIALEHSSFVGSPLELGDGDGFEAGRRLVADLPKEGLIHILLLAVRHRINATALAAGVAADLPPRVRVTGGLAGDGERFGETTVVWDEPLRDGIVAVGLYGDRLRVGYGSLGGWDPFGPERWVTRSEGSVLYELDGRPAIDLYRRYLGDQAEGLPATALLFPLSVRGASGEDAVVRTVLAVDEDSGSMTFAGDVPQGSRARLMRANFDRLVDGAVGAAQQCQQAVSDVGSGLALLISCVGRRMVLRQRVEEEIEGVREVLGPETTLAGFYSYGEISPLGHAARCELHNQTMTITTLAEV